MANLTNKCEYCGDMFQNYGFATHKRYCKTQSAMEREEGRLRRIKYRGEPAPHLIEDVHVNGNRAYITISIDLASLRVVLSQLVPYINFHGIEIK